MKTWHDRAITFILCRHNPRIYERGHGVIRAELAIAVADYLERWIDIDRPAFFKSLGLKYNPER